MERIKGGEAAGKDDEMKRRVWWMAAAAWAAACGLAVAGMSAERAAEAKAAAAKGAAWLAAQQAEDGHWGSPETPALTALAFWALQRTDAEGYAEAIAKGRDFVLRHVQPDGSIWKRPEPGTLGGGLANYNTAVCLSALHSLGDKDLTLTMQRARTYLAGTQYRNEGLFRGGIGYSPDEVAPHADLSNSHMVFEAMRLTQDVEDLRAAGEPKADLDWDAALAFLAQVQNLASVNTNSWISTEADDQGGFIYRPMTQGAMEKTKRGKTDKKGREEAAGLEGGDIRGADMRQPPDIEFPETKLNPPLRLASPGGEEPRERLERGENPVPPLHRPGAGEAVKAHPYGSMTYAGILSLIYAKVDAKDERVVAAKDWAMRHWTLTENPGMGQEGLYYFYNTLSKCMAAMGEETVAMEDGDEVRWQDDLADRLMDLQSDDGFWVNENNRWWDADPVLVTSYSLLALSSAMEGNP